MTTGARLAARRAPLYVWADGSSMLAALRLTSVRHALVIVLMILSALAAVERVHAVLNELEHGLGVAHASPMAQLAADAADHDFYHAPAAADPSPDLGEAEHAPGPHHHHSEGPQVAPVLASFTVDVIGAPSDAVFARSDTRSPQSLIFGLERPPKALEAQA